MCTYPKFGIGDLVGLIFSRALAHLCITENKKNLSMNELLNISELLVYYISSHCLKLCDCAHKSSWQKFVEAVVIVAVIGFGICESKILKKHINSV